MVYSWARDGFEDRRGEGFLAIGDRARVSRSLHPLEPFGAKGWKGNLVKIPEPNVGA